MKTLLAFVLLFLCCSARADQKAYGDCSLGNQKVTTQGLLSTTKVMGSFPSCTVTVYEHGVSPATLATLFSDDSGTSLANPFTANSTGQWFFYAQNGHYDVIRSGGGFPSPNTLFDIFLSEPTIIDASSFPGADACAKISAAAKTLPVAGGTIDARAFTGTQACASNPYSGNTGPMDLLINGIFSTAAQWVVPDDSFMRGWGPSNASTNGAGVSAANTFPINTPLIRMTGTERTRIENVFVNCNNIAGSKGIYATDINEQAGVRFALIVNCAGPGIEVDASAFSNIPAQTYLLEHIEVYGGTATTNTTDLIHLKGNGGGGPRLVSDITANGISGHQAKCSIHTENFHDGTFIGIHGEGVVDVVFADTMQSTQWMNISDGPGVTDSVFNIPDTDTTNSYTIQGISRGAATYALKWPTGNTATDSYIPLIVLGTTATPPSFNMLGGLNTMSPSLYVPLVRNTRAAGPTSGKLFSLYIGSRQADGNPAAELISCDADGASNCISYFNASPAPGGAQTGYPMAFPNGVFFTGISKFAGIPTFLSTVPPRFTIAPAFANLPACGSGNQGSVASINDSNTVTWGATAAGGGGNYALLTCNGSNWTVIGK